VGVEERRDQERELRRHSIVDTALHVFAEKGIKEATIDDIASEAQLGKGTIYYYFDSKEAILAGAIEATVDAHFEGLFNRSEPLKTPYDIAEALLVGCVENFKKNPAMFKVLYMVLAEPRTSHPESLKGFVRRHMVWLDELRAVTVPILEKHDLNPNSFLHFVGTHVHGIMVLASSGRPVDGLLQDSLTALSSILNKK
jgi:AcrR family transcriptional regulator